MSVSQAEQKRRAKSAMIIEAAAFTAQGYGQPALAAELHALAEEIMNGERTFNTQAVLDA